MAEWTSRILEELSMLSEDRNDILVLCAEGPVQDFAQKWPDFMQQHLHPKIVAKQRSAKSQKTLEVVY